MDIFSLFKGGHNEADDEEIKRVLDEETKSLLVDDMGKPPSFHRDSTP
jgi:hypothetical protein